MSFHTKCVDRVEHGGPVGRVDAESHSDRDSDQKGDDRRPRPYHHRDARKLRIERWYDHAYEDANQPAGGAYNGGLDQELLDDVSSPRL